MISIWIAKLLGFIISLLHLGQASNFPGKIALIFKKDILKFFKLQSNCKIILITGTNGKSTTCGLLANILKTAGKKVASNKSGANLLSGIITSLCHYADIFGNLKYDYLILEVDEATLPILTAQIKPYIIAVTNFFRDQLDRFGELDTTVKLIEKGVNNYRDIIVVLNADDARVALINTENKKVYYGLDKDERNTENSLKTWLVDPEEITSCSRCNFKRPMPDFLVTEFKTDNLTINFDIVYNNQKHNFFLPIIGVFNLYNALCAISIAKLVTEVTSTQIQKGFQSYSTIFGRGEKIKFENKTAWIYLIKNPTGTTEVLKTLSKIPKSRFLIAINDNFADGRDVSWLWDARFDFLNNHTKDIFISGKRALDMAVRLQYTNIKTEQIKVDSNIKRTIKKAIRSIDDDETLFILPTYTVLLEMQRKRICKAQPLT